MRSRAYGVWSAIVCLLATIATRPSMVAAVEPQSAERALVDFQSEPAAGLKPNRVEAKFAKSGDRYRLEVASPADGSYPGVRFEPNAGPWNLEGYETVTAVVRNLGDVPTRVLLVVNNPGADSRNGCSANGLTLGPGERGLLSVTLGEWYGQAKPFDKTKIANCEFLVDRPQQPQQFAVEALRAERREKFELARAEQNSFFQSLVGEGGRNAQFGRGINLGNALEAPREGDWGVKLEEDYFRAIAEAGFDCIRLPVRWSAHAEQTAPYAIDPQFFARVDWAVEQALSRGLSVVMNVHHYAEMDERPDEHRERFLALWRQIAEHYRDRPAKLAFELLNEPHDKLTAAKWNATLAEALGVVRVSNPTRTVVVGPVAWNAIRELPSLELPEADRNLVVTVHYYLPFDFTHQGAHWIDPKTRPPVGKRWTGTEDERTAVLRDLDAAAQWGLTHRRPIFLGEFGALNKADLESRAAWTKFVADEATRRRMSFAYWEFCSGFGAYDPQRREWLAPLRDALVPGDRRK